jgi:hypothetical protein
MCFRSRIFQYAEQLYARKRPNTSDGIFYVDGTTLDLTVSLVFLERHEVDNFQSLVYDFTMPRGRRKREGVNLAAELISRIIAKEGELVRIFNSDYDQTAGDVSPLCQSVSEMSEITIVPISTEITPAIRLKMIEKPVNITLVGKNVEECHLKSQTKYPNDKNKDGNIIYLDRILHEHFDGINTTDKRIPSFKLQYVSHSSCRVDIVIDGQSFSKHRITVDVVFRRIESLMYLAGLLRDDTEKIDDYTYRTCLFFDNPTEAKVYLDFKANATTEKWEEFEGTTAMLMQGAEEQSLI